MPSKKTVKKHTKRLVSSWRYANDLAWSTVGAPGPVFFDTNPGPDKDKAWEAFHQEMEAKRSQAGALYKGALQKAPSWFREDEKLMDKCFNKVFVHEGGAVIGPGILS